MRYLFLLLLPFSAFSEIKVSPNLVQNGDFESGNSNGWTTSGTAVVISDCCGSSIGQSSYDLEFGDFGSIEQDFNLTSDTITQQMLNNGISLKSQILSQNGEGGEYPAWSSNGDADSFTVRLQIKDENNNVLNSISQTRTQTTGIDGELFTNSVSYTGTGSNIGNIKISGVDSNAPAYLGGSNIDEITAWIEYNDTVLSATQTAEISQTFENIEQVIELAEQFNPEEVENLIIEEIVFQEVVAELPEIFEIFEISQEEELIEETLVVAPEIISEPNIVESQVEEQIPEENTELIAEVFEEIVELPSEVPEETPVSPEETPVDPDQDPDQNPVDPDENPVDSDADEPNNTPVSPTESTTVAISISDIQRKVDQKIKTTEGRLKAVSIIVAKVMSETNNKIDSYSLINAEIFEQPVIIDRNIDAYISQSYVDIRNIYNDRTFEDRENWISR
tara:strand:+ start:1273 stop:2619 length:1347 start_codon:yes stop_codon:yes gene_type:complete